VGARRLDGREPGLTPTLGAEAKHREVQWLWEDRYLEAARGDDFVGVQSYTSQPVDTRGIVAHPERPTTP
jgi:beta-glucosidase